MSKELSWLLESVRVQYHIGLVGNKEANTIPAYPFYYKQPDTFQPGIQAWSIANVKPLYLQCPQGEKTIVIQLLGWFYYEQHTLTSLVVATWVSSSLPFN